MILGEDESVFSQYHFKSKKWVGPQGQRPLLLEIDGLNIMISLLQSRNTSNGVQSSCIQMEEINDSQQGTNYVNIDAAMAIHGQPSKKDLKELPVCYEF